MIETSELPKGPATPIADMTDMEVTRALVDAARKYDHDNRPKGDRGSVPPNQVARLIIGALGAMQFDDAPEDPAAAAASYEREISGLRALLAEICDDVEHVIGGNAEYIDRDMLDGYRDRAGLQS